MSNLKIITQTCGTEICEVTKLEAGVGIPFMLEFDWPFKGKDKKKVGYFKLTGYSSTDTSEKNSVDIYFDIPDIIPSYEEFIEMINEVVGTYNKFENSIAFHATFHEYKIRELMDEIFKDLSIPYIDESQYHLLDLNDLYAHGDKIVLTSNDVHKKVYPEELKWMRNPTFDLVKRKLKFQYTHKYEWHEANIDHEKLFSFYVKDDNIVNELRRLIPSLSLGYKSE